MIKGHFCRNHVVENGSSCVCSSDYKRESGEEVHVAIPPRWSPKLLLVCLFKGNLISIVLVFSCINLFLYH